MAYQPHSSHSALTATQAQHACEAIAYSSLKGERSTARLDGLIQGGLPINGVWSGDGARAFDDPLRSPGSLIELAARLRSEPALLYLIEKGARPAYCKHIVHHCLWSAAATELALSKSPRLKLNPSDIFGGAIWTVAPETIPILAKRGIDLVSPFVSSFNRKHPLSPLIFAAGSLLHNSNPGNMIRALLDCGVSPHTPDRGGNTFLHVAVLQRDTDSQPERSAFDQILEVASGSGINLDMPNDAGRSALHEALRVGRTYQLSSLLHAGADPTFCVPGGRTPLDDMVAAPHTTRQILSAWNARQAIGAILRYPSEASQAP